MSGIADVEDREVVCPSCRRFVGTYEKCPYCGAEVYKRLSVRFFKWGSLVFAFIGLFFLWLSVRGIKAPLVKAKDITATMSMATIRVEGRLVGQPRLHPEWKSLYVRIDDKTGMIALSAYEDVAAQIMKLEPDEGDLVSAQGMLRVQEGAPPKLQIQNPRHFRIIKRAAGTAGAKPIAVSSITTGMRGLPVIVKGKLVRAGLLSFGAFKGELEDETGRIVIWIDPASWPGFDSQAKSRLVTDALVKVRGRVKTFFDKKSNDYVLEVAPDGKPGCVTGLN